VARLVGDGNGEMLTIVPGSIHTQERRVIGIEGVYCPLATPIIAQT
jgi:hypothetical protein